MFSGARKTIVVNRIDKKGHNSIFYKILVEIVKIIRQKMSGNQNVKSFGWPHNRPIGQRDGPKLRLTSIPVNKKIK